MTAAKLKHLAIAIALALLAGCTTGPETSRDGASKEAQVDALFNAAITPDGPGCAVGVYQNGEILLAKGYGVASSEDGRTITSRTTFNLGSASKPFTALAALLLEQQGKLSLDDDVRRWVPALPDYGRPIRVRDLLQHTSGLRDHQALETLSGRPLTTMAAFLDLMAGQRSLHFAPGTAHEYSHADYHLLALVVERVAGEPFGEHLRKAVLAPLGMTGTFVHAGAEPGRAPIKSDRALGHRPSASGARVVFPDAVLFGGSDLYTSVEDLSRWDRNFDQPSVGGKETMSRMVGRPTLASGETIPYAFGLRLGEYRGLRTVARGGHPPGMRVEFVRYPDQRFGVAVLCNSDGLWTAPLTEGVADLYLGDRMKPKAPRPVAPAAIELPANQLDTYAGMYRPLETGEEWNLLPIAVRDGKLGELIFDDATDEVFFPMTPAGDGRFFEIGATGNVGMFAFRSAPGKPLQLELSWNGGDVEKFERLDASKVWRPSAAALSEYAGAWFSDELDSTWRLEPRGERLVLRRRGQRDLTLLPVARDLFIRGFGDIDSSLVAKLQFVRDAAGRLTHLVVSTRPGEDSARDISFRRYRIP